ncbi:hypothetical protein JL720_6126 [Aureococcus anophagefferens]|nr:hypothetical protein JL720_6126 [Aureococcus anophagefferens]
MAVATPVDEIATTTDSEAFFTTTACYAHPSPQAPFVPRALDAAPPPFEPTIAMVAEMDLGEALSAAPRSPTSAALGAPSAAPGGRLPPLPLDLSGRSLDLGAPPLSSGRRRPRRARRRARARRRPPPAYDAAYDPPPAYDDAPRQPSGGLARCGSLDGLWREVASPRHRGGDAEAYLQRLNLPLGLKLQLQKSVDTYVERIWIIDNSGSMSTCDGHKIMRSACGDVSVTCSRWEELTDTIHWHATLAARLRAPTTFVLLNPPGNGEPQSCRVGYERDKRWLHRGHDSIYCDPADGSITHTVDEDSAEFEVERLKNMLASGPGGKTPLCAAVTSVCGVLARRAPELRSRGRKACVVIASDGAATDGDVHAALAPLRDLPVWVIVRLCTDEEKVAEAADLAKLILGPQATAALPHPELDFPAFSRALKGALACEPAVWCPLRKRLLPWINVRKLRKLRKRKPLLSHPALLRAQSSSAACVLS